MSQISISDVRFGKPKNKSKTRTPKDTYDLRIETYKTEIQALTEAITFIEKEMSKRKITFETIPRGLLDNNVKTTGQFTEKEKDKLYNAKVDAYIQTLFKGTKNICYAVLNRIRVLYITHKGRVKYELSKFTRENGTRELFRHTRRAFNIANRIFTRTGRDIEAETDIDELKKKLVDYKRKLDELNMFYAGNTQANDLAIHLICIKKDTSINEGMILGRIRDNILFREQIKELNKLIKKSEERITKLEGKNKHIIIDNTGESKVSDEAQDEFQLTDIKSDLIETSNSQRDNDVRGAEEAISLSRQYNANNLGVSVALRNASRSKPLVKRRESRGGKTTQRNRRYKTNAKAPFYYRRDRTKRRYRH
jgi:hypothetical protein